MPSPSLPPTGTPDVTTAAGRAAADAFDDALRLIADADPTEVPPPLTSTGPADDVHPDQDPDFEESEVDDADAEHALADPAVTALATDPEA